MEVKLGEPLAGPRDPSDLVRRIRAGDRIAEDELIRCYGRVVKSIIDRRVRDVPVVEDLCQDAFRLALEKVRRGDPRESEKLAGFVCGIARNLAIEYLRGTEQTQPLEDGFVAFDPKPGPLDTVLLEEEKKGKIEAIRQVLKDLSPRDSEILKRFYLDEEDKESICRGLGLSSLHFNRVLHRARERFRKFYGERGRDNDR